MDGVGVVCRAVIAQGGKGARGVVGGDPVPVVPIVVDGFVVLQLLRLHAPNVQAGEGQIHPRADGGVPAVPEKGGFTAVQAVAGPVELLRIGPSAGTVYLRFCAHAPALDLDGTLSAVVKEEGGRKPQVISAVRPGLQLIDCLPVIVSVPVHPVRRG